MYQLTVDLYTCTFPTHTRHTLELEYKVLQKNCSIAQSDDQRHPEVSLYLYTPTYMYVSYRKRLKWRGLGHKV